MSKYEFKFYQSFEVFAKLAIAPAEGFTQLTLRKTNQRSVDILLLRFLIDKIVNLDQQLSCLWQQVIK